jgi:hypothetical protein
VEGARVARGCFRGIDALGCCVQHKSAAGIESLVEHSGHGTLSTRADPADGRAAVRSVVYPCVPACFRSAASSAADPVDGRGAFPGRGHPSAVRGANPSARTAAEITLVGRRSPDGAGARDCYASTAIGTNSVATV